MVYTDKWGRKASGEETSLKTVKDMSRLSGVSVRTLHYYDQIDLLKPTFVGDNGYRYYDDRAFDRLQEILLFRELDFSLKDIKKILFDPAYDQKEALARQIQLLELEKARIERVLNHARSLQKDGGNRMNFTAYDKSQLEVFRKESKELWGDTQAYQEFEKRGSEQDFTQISDQMFEIFSVFGDLKHLPADHQDVQAEVKYLQDYISQHFYTCSPEVLAVLGQTYVTNPEFKSALDQAGGQGTADFVNSAIELYCQ